MTPLVTNEVDLRDFEFMPIEIRRLFASETWILGNPEEKCAALSLWLEAWHQVPAASLPDNDRVLAHLSQSGHRWPKVKAHAMRGWTLCSDGRWYHSVVAEKALEAWDKHRKASSRGKAGAAKRWGTGSSYSNSEANGTSIEQPLLADSKGNDIGEEKNKEGSKKRIGKDEQNAVSLAVALRAAGVNANADHPAIIGWANDGVVDTQVVEAVRIAREDRGKACPPVAYLDPIVQDLSRRSVATRGGHIPGSRTASAVAALESLREEQT